MNTTSKDLTNAVSVDLDTKIALSLSNGGQISDYGISEVEAILFEVLLAFYREKVKDNADLDSYDKENVARQNTRDAIVILWRKTSKVWLVTKKDDASGNFYTGTLPKRISKHFHVDYSLNLDAATLAKIGEVAKRHTSSADEYLIDFTTDISWDSGDFGDNGSCYWGGRSHAKDIITDDLNGGAVRFYENDHGVARAWVIPQAPKSDTFIIFNGYGHQAVTIARILATHFGLSYKQIVLKNNHTGDGTLWINDSKGYVLGPQATIDTISKHDFQVSDTVCYSCGDAIDEDDSYSYDGEVYCESCFSESYSFCEHCGESYPNDDIRRVHVASRYSPGTYNEGYRCEGCASDYVECSHCQDGEYYEVDHFTMTDNGEYYCEDCADEVNTCELCGATEFRMDFTVINNEIVCADCAKSNYVACPDCNELVERQHGIGHCEDCDAYAGQCTRCKLDHDMLNVLDTVCVECRDIILEKRLAIAASDEGLPALDPTIPAGTWNKLFCRISDPLALAAIAEFRNDHMWLIVANFDGAPINTYLYHHEGAMASKLNLVKRYGDSIQVYMQPDRWDNDNRVFIGTYTHLDSDFILHGAYEQTGELTNA